ncbi:MAG: Fumble domain-containing protein [Gemmatimonadaceae bacterium]|nr:Fumble domain-containing protein [Gemmatimonadaceae bacterium]
MSSPIAMNRSVVAIDFGASNTDVVVRTGAALRRWNVPSRGQPDERRVREVLAHGGLSPRDVGWIAVTGGNRERLPTAIDERTVHRVDEVQAIGRGGLALAGLDRAVVTSAGSGTAVVVAGPDGARHVTGTGVGGGTLVGLGRMLLDITDPHVLDQLALVGSPTELNLTIGEILGGAIGSLPPDTTAVNFGRVAREPMAATPADTAAALVNMVGQVIAIIAINAARATQQEHIVIVGHLSDLSSVRETFRLVGQFYGATLQVPEFGGYATATGALLVAEGM